MTPRRLSALATRALTAAFEEAGLDPARGARAADVARFVPGLSAVHARRPWHALILAGAGRRRVAGITLGRWVYVADARLLDHWGLVAHELVHVAQFEEVGTVRFLLRYVRDYLAGRMRGLGDHEAYLALPDEVEARAVEATAQRAGGPDTSWWGAHGPPSATLAVAPSTPGPTMSRFDPSALAMPALACVTLGLAPFAPEPHVVEKIRWVLSGAEGMAPLDWFDLVMHGAPWVWLVAATAGQLAGGAQATNPSTE